MLYSQGCRGECCVWQARESGDSWSRWESLEFCLSRKQWDCRMYKRAALGELSDPLHPTLLQAHGRMMETGNCKAL